MQCVCWRFLSSTQAAKGLRSLSQILYWHAIRMRWLSEFLDANETIYTWRLKWWRGGARAGRGAITMSQSIYYLYLN